MIPNCELVKVDGTQFLVFKGQDLISNHLKKELYENDIHQLALKILINEPDGTVLDIGANLGTFCVPLAKKVPKHKYHAFEPQRIIHYQLCANTFINGLDNVHCHNFGLSDKEERLMLTIPDYASEGNIGAFSIDKEVRENEYECTTEGRKEPMVVFTLDSGAHKNVRLIKIDVEGHELEVIKGGIKTIKANNYPPIIFEAWTWKPWYQEKRKSLLEYLEGHGYEIQQLGENNLAQHPKYKDKNK
jgi:FkbM family methyltransferase